MEASLLSCARDSRHAQVDEAPCPWCRIEEEGGPSHFAAGGGRGELAHAWHAAQAIESPGPAGPPPGAAALVKHAARTRRRASLRRLHARWEKECGEAGLLTRRREVEKARRAGEPAVAGRPPAAAARAPGEDAARWRG